MNKKVYTALVAILAMFVGCYWYFSPYLALNGIQSAAKAKDADQLNAYVDYPKLRESFKGELSASLAEKFPTASNGASGSAAQAGEAFGAMLGLALVDKMVDAIVRPEVVMRAINNAKLEAEKSGRNDSAETGEKKDVSWALERKTSDLVVAYAADPSKPDARFGVVLERSGFADWKMTGVRLPGLK